MGLLNCQCGKTNKEEMWNQLEMIFGMIDATLDCIVSAVESFQYYLYLWIKE